MQKGPEKEIGQKGDQDTHSYEHPPAPALPQVEKDSDQKKRRHQEPEDIQREAIGKQRNEGQDHMTGMGFLDFPDSPASVDERDRE